MAASAGFDLTVAENGDGIKVGVLGDLDCASAPRLGQAMAALAGQHRVVILDMSSTEFMDCAGLGALVKAHDDRRQLGGDIVLESPTRAVRRLLELTGMDESIRTMAGPMKPREDELR